MKYQVEFPTWPLEYRSQEYERGLGDQARGDQAKMLLSAPFAFSTLVAAIIVDQRKRISTSKGLATDGLAGISGINNQRKH